MFIWWQQFWNTNELQQFSFVNASSHRNHIAKCRSTSSVTHHQLPYSVHHSNCNGQSKCIRKTLTDHSSRMNSFCSVIILIHCFNVLVLAIGSENLNNNNQPQPCDRSRRVFTDIQGEISNGPPGYNYTQVSFIHFVVVIITETTTATLYTISIHFSCHLSNFALFFRGTLFCYSCLDEFFFFKFNIKCVACLSTQDILHLHK